MMFVAVVDCHVQCSLGRAQPRRVDDDDDASSKVVHCARAPARAVVIGCARANCLDLTD